MSDLSSVSAVSSSNSPPLNQSTGSMPTKPPFAIPRNNAPASSVKRSGTRRACSSIRVNMWPGSRPTSSANMQNTSRLTKCATTCGSWPRSRSACASDANDSAACSVSDCRVSPGRSRSGSENAHLSRSRVAASARSSRPNSCVLLTQLVQLVRIRNRCMSETISSGGFSSASAYRRSWPKAESRSARLPLYSHAKWWRFQTSAQPSPPVSLRAPRSKQYVSPVGSASAGVGSPSSRHRSMKCSCEAERSFNSAARHLSMNSYGVMGAFRVAHDPAPAATRARSEGWAVAAITSAATPRHGLPQEKSSRERPGPAGVTKEHLLGQQTAGLLGVAPGFTPGPFPDPRVVRGWAVGARESADPGRRVCDRGVTGDVNWGCDSITRQRSRARAALLL